MSTQFLLQLYFLYFRCIKNCKVFFFVNRWLAFPRKRPRINCLVTRNNSCYAHDTIQKISYFWRELNLVTLGRKKIIRNKHKVTRFVTSAELMKIVYFIKEREKLFIYLIHGAMHWLTNVEVNGTVFNKRKKLQCVECPIVVSRGMIYFSPCKTIVVNI